MKDKPENPQWIDVKDRLPTEEESEYDSFLCWSVKFGDEKRSLSSHAIILDFGTGKWRNDGWRDYELNADYHRITHWIPLPEPPTADAMLAERSKSNE